MSVLTLTDAKEHLNISGSAFDAELQAFIDAAEAAIGSDGKCGPLAPVAKTERLSGGRKGLALRYTPVISLTSVTPANGTAYDVTLLDLDKRAGVVEWTSGASFAPGKYDVVYQAGRATVPDDLMMGVKELVRHTWAASQRGGSRRPGSPPSDTLSNTLPGSAYLFVYRVQEYILPHLQTGNA